MFTMTEAMSSLPIISKILIFTSVLQKGVIELTAPLIGQFLQFWAPICWDRIKTISTTAEYSNAAYPHDFSFINPIK